jgi:hypothetical protein
MADGPAHSSTAEPTSSTIQAGLGRGRRDPRTWATPRRPGADAVRDLARVRSAPRPKLGRPTMASTWRARAAAIQARASEASARGERSRGRRWLAAPQTSSAPRHAGRAADPMSEFGPRATVFSIGSAPENRRDLLPGLQADAPNGNPSRSDLFGNGKPGTARGQAPLLILFSYLCPDRSNLSRLQQRSGSHDQKTCYSDHEEMTADLKTPMTSNSSPITQNNSTRTI